MDRVDAIPLEIEPSPPVAPRSLLPMPSGNPSMPSRAPPPPPPPLQPVPSQDRISSSGGLYERPKGPGTMRPCRPPRRRPVLTSMRHSSSYSSCCTSTPAPDALGTTTPEHQSDLCFATGKSGQQRHQPTSALDESSEFPTVPVPVPVPKASTPTSSAPFLALAPTSGPALVDTIPLTAHLASRNPIPTLSPPLETQAVASEAYSNNNPIPLPPKPALKPVSVSARRAHHRPVVTSLPVFSARSPVSSDSCSSPSVVQPILRSIDPPDDPSLFPATLPTPIAAPAPAHLLTSVAAHLSPLSPQTDQVQAIPQPIEFANPIVPTYPPTGLVSAIPTTVCPSAPTSTPIPPTIPTNSLCLPPLVDNVQRNPPPPDDSSAIVPHAVLSQYKERLAGPLERAIYRLGHYKLAETHRPLNEQVMISNLMRTYLRLVNPSVGALINSRVTLINHSTTLQDGSASDPTRMRNGFDLPLRHPGTGAVRPSNETTSPAVHSGA